MSSDGYTLKELVNELRRENKEIRAEIASMNALLERTYDQACKTNGRLKKAEEEVRSLQNWKSILVGAFSLITILGLPNIIKVLSDTL